MITLGDLYTVLCATAPLYTAMLLAYAAVRWWRTFTPVQCSGINRFVAAFAVPVLSFHFIAHNDPYRMDLRFLLADTLAKLLALALVTAVSLASAFFSPRQRRGAQRLDWPITVFSVATLPNTLVMGIPLLRAMYGDFTQPLMVQLVVLQCIVWYTLLLFLFEYRAAALLIRERFPGAAASAIAKIDVDGDVISLDGRDPLYAETSEADADGMVRIRIRRSAASSAPGSSAVSTPTPRMSSMSGAEIYSSSTPNRHTFTLGEITIFARASCASSSSDAYSLQPTPRASSFTDVEVRSPAAPASGGAEKVRGREVSEEKELSFRSTTKFVDAYEMDEEANDQAMPHPLVMLRLILVVVGRKLSRNPNTYSSILGLLWSLISFRWELTMPDIIKNSITIISDAGLGMAMFSLGLFMALQQRIIACGAKMAIISMFIRFICGPIIMCAASLAVGLKGVKLHTAIVQAALPQGIVPFVFAREYGLHPDILSAGVIFGMLVSLPITLVYYILLGL
ncbi:auxin efflux carrier component 6 [Ananas comosus]|uniref:Auxin efflux carrier component n=1 Tax=Ananas comosus TaxID=4615 RepID=A0A6P5FSY2_ANACO|nr:auxin efflux carrier component 6 [Ananas comosus]